MELDDDFVETAADSARRSTAIADLTKKQQILSLIAISVLLGFLGTCIFSNKQPDVAFVLVVIIPLMQLYKCESDLKLLRVVDRLQSYNKLVA